MNRALTIALLCVLAGCGSSTTDAPSEALPTDAAADTTSELDAEPVDDAEPDASPADSSVADAATDSKSPPSDTRPVDAKTDTRVADAAPTSDAPLGYPALAVKDITGATAAELTMIADGVALANETMKTKCFEDFILAASWTETEGLTQAQIYAKLASGVVTIDVDMFTGTWYQNNVSKTIGYENEPGLVHMNRYFVDTAYMVASNLIHEAEGHSQGFSHYGVKATSVPYGLNDAFEKCSPVGP